MTYAPTTWVDDSPPGTGTPVNAANLNKIEAGIAAALPSSSVASAGVGVLGNKLAAGDSQPAFALMGDGRLWWGPGGAVPVDTTLYRSSAGALKTDGIFQTGSAIQASNWIGANMAGAATQVIIGSGSGFIGPGAVASIIFGMAGDTYLYRSSNLNLKTNGTFWAGASIVVDESNAGSRLYWGSTLDASLYRLASGTLKTDGHLVVGGNLTVLGTGGGGAALTSQSSFLTGDVGFASSSTLYDGPSLTLAAGTWLIIGAANILSGSSTNVYARLTDGTTTFCDGNHFIGSNTAAVSIPLSATVSPTGSTAYKIQGSAGNSGVATMKATASVNGVANKATYLVALKIA